jgi:hypothetical protein
VVCLKCGGAVPDGRAICPQCGTAVANAAVRSVPARSVPRAAPALTSTGPAHPKLTPEQQRCWDLAQTYAGRPSTDSKAKASMVFGILSVLLFFIFAGIPAIVLGHMSLAKIRRSKGRLTGDEIAMSGLVLGYISIAFSVLLGAIAIPMARDAIAKKRAGVSTIRSLMADQTTYLTTYPAQGYASSLNALGDGDPRADCADPANHTSEHACLVDRALTCTSGSWCTNGIYNFSLAAQCGGDGVCTDYVAMATPITIGSASKSYCATSDAVLRSKSGPQLTTLVTPEECQSWAPIN